MKRLLALLLLCGNAFAATVATSTPGPWDLFKGTKKISAGHATYAGCEAAAISLKVAAKYTCRTSTVVITTVVPDTDHSGHGPVINTASIPLPAVGAATFNVKATTEVAPDGDGAFRTFCTPSHYLKDDPIVFPGQPGATHLHTFFGNTGANYATTQATLAAGNSTCRGGIADRSGRWVPTMIDERGDVVVPHGLLMYYKTGLLGYFVDKAFQFTPPPAGLRMVAGNAKSSAEQKGMSFECVGPGTDYHSRRGYIVGCTAGQEMWQSISFMQCWNGRDLDSADHKSHMAYPVQKQTSPFNWHCPDTHPVALPEIAFQVIYKAPATGSTAGWRLSSDMYEATKPGGLSSHGDWWNGWQPDILQTWMQRCVNDRKDCHAHLLGDGRAIF